MEALKYFTGTEGLAGSAKYIAYAPFRISSLDIIAANEPWYKDGKTEMLPQMPTAQPILRTIFLWILSIGQIMKLRLVKFGKLGKNFTIISYIY